MVVKVYPISPAPAVLRAFVGDAWRHQLQIVDDPILADVLVSGSQKSINSVVQTAGEHQALLLWTNEPRWSSNVSGTMVTSGRTIHVMNCFTGDVYVDQYHYLWVAKYKKMELLSRADYEAKKQASTRPVFCMASNHGDGRPFMIFGSDRNLYDLRRDIAIYGWRRGLVEIFGKGWPENISHGGGRDSSPWQEWEDSKLDIGGRFLFNICLENTNAKYYITEKIWHSLMTRCLPVYFSGETQVGEVLSEQAMICVDRYSSKDDIFDCIERIKPEEYIERINTLIDQFNKIVEDPDILRRSREVMMNRFYDKLLSIY